MKIIYLILLLSLLTITIDRNTPKEYIELERVSFYTLSPQETDSSPEFSACGRSFSNQVAVSRDLLTRIPCGTNVTVYTTIGNFSGRVNDTMNSRYVKSVDVLVDNRTQALALGVTKGFLIYED